MSNVAKSDDSCISIFHFSNVSSWIWRVASGSLAETWGPSFNTRIIFLRVKYLT